MPSEWQPIETAPKDGTPVRLRLENGIEATGEYWGSPSDEIVDGAGWAIDVTLIDDPSELLDAKPTHWQPLEVSNA